MSVCNKQWGLCPIATQRGKRPTGHRCPRDYGHGGHCMCEDCDPPNAPPGARERPLPGPDFY